jgi:uncharacterized protein (TIGR03435 family)
MIDEQTMTRRLLPCITVAAHLIFCARDGESQQRSFEVASVKASQGDGRDLFEISPGGDRLTIRNTFLGVILMKALNFDEPQFTMPTSPLLRDRFDIEAKVDGSASRSEMMLMLQRLLTERFKLAFHRESKEVPGYALVPAKGGPKLRTASGQSGDECKHRTGADMRLIFENCPMSDLVGGYVLYSMLGRRFVADETGLTGKYDFELAASWELPPNPREGSPAPRIVNPGAPSIFTALEQQLGLKLQAKRIAIDFVTIDHVERPSEN